MAMRGSRVRRLSTAAWWCGALLAAVALPSASSSDADVRVLVWAASILLPAAALLAGMALARGHAALGGCLLVVSAASPTYFAWPVSLLPLGLAAAVWLDARANQRELSTARGRLGGVVPDRH